MRLTANQYQADRRRMKAFVATRIPEEGIEVVVAWRKLSYDIEWHCGRVGIYSTPCLR